MLEPSEKLTGAVRWFDGNVEADGTGLDFPPFFRIEETLPSGDSGGGGSVAPRRNGLPF